VTGNHEKPAAPSQHWRWIAAAWGFAEAILFFIVPDVFTSRMALTHSPRQAVASCGWAVLGALLGGNLLFLFAQLNPSGAAGFLAALDLIPGISSGLIEFAGEEVRRRGSAAFFTTAFGGVPYKLCALQASLQGMGYAAFLSMTVLSRALRFLVVTAFALGCRYFLLGRVAPKVRTHIHLGCWAVFYGWYFYVMSQ